MWQTLRLRAKINILLFLVLAVFLVISLFWQYRQQRDLLFSEAIDKAKIITSEATRTREYLSRQLKAGHIELNKDRYGIIPVVAANRVGQLVAEDLAYTIRHTSNRFRNPGNAPDIYEQVMLRRFAEEKNLNQIAEFTKIDLFLSYTNSCSIKHISDMLRLLNSSYKDGHDMKIFWTYEQNDEEAKEAGHELESLLDIPFEYIETETESKSVKRILVKNLLTGKTGEISQRYWEIIVGNGHDKDFELL